MVAVTGYIPLGYYKDEAKTAQTFRTFEGRRWSVPGDWAEVAADGALQLLGRGSVCINTGGEKVFPEEVEEALKTHPGVRDAVAVGHPRRSVRRADLRSRRRPRTGRVPIWRSWPGTFGSRLAAYKAPTRPGPRRHHRPRPERQGRLQAPQGARNRSGRLNPIRRPGIAATRCYRLGTASRAARPRSGPATWDGSPKVLSTSVEMWPLVRVATKASARGHVEPGP